MDNFLRKSAGRNACSPLSQAAVVVAGDIRVSTEPVAMKAVLGSCVAVCIFDEHAGVGGMNHFVLPYPMRQDHDSSRYGATAICQLIEQIVGSGGRRRRLLAKAFGGASRSPDSLLLNTGARNSQFAAEFLQRQRIPLVKSLFGGGEYFKVIFYPYTGKALVQCGSGEARTQHLSPLRAQSGDGGSFEGRRKQ